LLTRDSIKVKNGVHVLVGHTLFLILVIKELVSQAFTAYEKKKIMHTANIQNLNK